MSQVFKSDLKIQTANEIGKTVSERKANAERAGIAAGGGSAACSKIVDLIANAHRVITQELENGAFDEIAKMKDPAAIAGLLKTKLSKVAEQIDNAKQALHLEQVSKNGMAKAFGEVEDSAKRIIESEKAKIEKLIRDAEEAEKALAETMAKAEAPKPKTRKPRRSGKASKVQSRGNGSDTR